jgi:thioredoxin-like negative regulator of GroEL
MLPAMRAAILAVAVLVLLASCTRSVPEESSVTPGLAEAAKEDGDAIAILDELEQLIEQGKDSEDDRVYAYDRIKKLPDDGTAAWAFARAATTGRVAELRGAGAGKLVGETEKFARLALERDPEFRDGEVKRMLGTLYVKAPARLVEHGDAEDGLTMLEDLAAEAPNEPRNRLRVAEAYIHLGDPDPAGEHLCAALRKKSEFRQDEQKLLDALVKEAGGPGALPCEQGG